MRKYMLSQSQATIVFPDPSDQPWHAPDPPRFGRPRRPGALRTVAHEFGMSHEGIRKAAHVAECRLLLRIASQVATDEQALALGLPELIEMRPLVARMLKAMHTRRQ